MQNDLEPRVAELERLMREHAHNGFYGGLIDLKNTFGALKTITVAGDLTNQLASYPTKFSDQVFIDATTAILKLYIYDTASKVWKDMVLSGKSGTNAYNLALAGGGSVLLTFTDGILTS